MKSAEITLNAQTEIMALKLNNKSINNLFFIDKYFFMIQI